MGVWWLDQSIDWIIIALTIADGFTADRRPTPDVSGTNNSLNGIKRDRRLTASCALPEVPWTVSPQANPSALLPCLESSWLWTESSTNSGKINLPPLTNECQIFVIAMTNQQRHLYYLKMYPKHLYWYHVFN